MDRQRTFGIVAHIDAGKTTLTERILHDAGGQTWLGSVDDGTATTDWLPQERSRGISITAAATRVPWAGHLLQIVDTPGHVDFVAEVERCLHVLDSVVVVVDGVRGVESQTEAVWQQAASRRLARLVFVNKLDRIGADYDAVVTELREVFACVPVPLVVPLLAADGTFAGLGDALTGAVQWFEGRPEPGLGPRLQAQMLAAHERLVEAVADVDPAVMAAVVDGRQLAPGALRASLRAAVVRGALVPVLAGAALWNRGVDWLLDAIAALLPSPAQRERSGLWGGERAGDAEAPFCGLVFKVHHVDSVWNYVRVVRGQLRPGMRCGRSRSGAPCEIAELWVMQADRHVCVDLAIPGEIVVVPGELGLRTGETLFEPGSPVVLPTPRFPAPVLAATFEADQAENAPQLLASLHEMAIDDPTLRVNREHGQIVVRGMGELHLEVIADQLRARTGVGFQASKPRVDRRETVLRAGVGSAEVRAFVGGIEHVASCRVAVAPLDGGLLSSGVLVASVVESLVPPSPLAAIAERDLRELVAAGTTVGPLMGVRVVLEALVSDADMAVEGIVQQATAKAMALAVQQAGLQFLEPWVALEVWCPEESCAAVLADLGTRRAVIGGVSSGQLGARIRGTAPLECMLGQVTRLRSITKGRGQVDLRPAGFVPMP